MGDIVKLQTLRLNVRRRTEGRKAYCRHLSVVVDELSRRVHCGSCHEELDPVQVLLEYADEERCFQYRTERAKGDLLRLETEVHALKQQLAYQKRKLRETEKKEPCQASARSA